MSIAIPQDAPMAERRTLGSLVPHPANIGKIAGAHLGITAPRMHLAGGGIANAENISQNMFQPINPGGIPNVDVNFITSPQLQNGPGPPRGSSAQPQKQPDSMQQIAQGTMAANGLTSLYGKFGGSGGLIPSAMNPASAAENASLASSADADTGLSSIINGGGAGADAIAEDAGASSGFWSTIGTALLSLFSEGGAVQGYADGGDVPGLSGMTSMLMRREAGETFHPSGLLNSAGPGRTDTINTNVPAGAYVIPADVVSGIGEGNTLAGSAIIDRMFSTQPHGIQARPIRRGEGPPRPPSSRPEPPPTGVQPGPTVNTAAINNAGGYAKGGDVHGKAPVVVAGGETVLHPRQIIAKFGSLKKGHATLDRWVVLTRQKIAKEMLALPNPVGSRIRKNEK